MDNWHLNIEFSCVGDDEYIVIALRSHHATIGHSNAFGCDTRLTVFAITTILRTRTSYLFNCMNTAPGLVVLVVAQCLL
jgi:hypothetical protein